MRGSDVMFVTNDVIIERGFKMHELVMSEAQLATFRSIQTREGALMQGYDVVNMFVKGRYDQWLDFTYLRGQLHLNPFARYYKDATGGPRCQRHYRMAYGMSNAMRLKSYAANPIPESLYNVLNTKEGATKYTHDDNIKMTVWIINQWPDLSPVFFAYVCRVYLTSRPKPSYMSDANIMATWLADDGRKPKTDVQHPAFDVRVRIHGHILAYISFMTSTYVTEPTTYRLAPENQVADTLYLMLYRPKLKYIADNIRRLNMRTVEEHFMATQGVSEADMMEAFGMRRGFFEGYVVANIVQPSKREALRLNKYHTLCCERIPERVLPLAPPKRARTIDEEIQAIGRVMLE